jgi:hypothetical protein
VSRVEPTRFAVAYAHFVLSAGMPFNPIFTSIAFRRIAGELALFKTLGIPLVHGWLVDPENHKEYAAVLRVEDYQAALNLINEDHSHGRPMAENAGHAGQSRPSMKETEKFQICQYLSRRFPNVVPM